MVPALRDRKENWILAKTIFAICTIGEGCEKRKEKHLRLQILVNEIMLKVARTVSKRRTSNHSLPINIICCKLITSLDMFKNKPEEKVLSTCSCEVEVSCPRQACVSHYTINSLAPILFALEILFITTKQRNFESLLPFSFLRAALPPTNLPLCCLVDYSLP